MTMAAEGEADTLPIIRLRRASVARFPLKGTVKALSRGLKESERPPSSSGGKVTD